jgi:argininosuccinate lyase
MPQKRNPDAAELVLGYTGRSAGALTGLILLVKGLPLAYNRGFQEERVHLFAAVDSVAMSLGILRGVYASLRIKGDRYDQSLAGDPSLATELADHLVAGGVSFREAHDSVATLVAEMDAEGRSLNELSPGDTSSLHLVLDPSGLETLLDPREATSRKRSRGGSSPEEIARHAALLWETLGRTYGS